MEGVVYELLFTAGVTLMWLAFFMIVRTVVVAGARAFRRRWPWTPKRWRGWVLVSLALAGLMIAATRRPGP